MERRIGNYTVVRELARGGMGVVFVARQVGLEREVALKLHLGAGVGDKDDSAKDARARERFDREAHAVARLRHPHVITVHEFGHHRGVPFLVMDLIEGESLEDRLGRQGALDPAEAIRIMSPVVEAVAYAHGEGILHRDLKPGNILIDREGRSFLTDFGLARDLSDERDRLTRSGQLLGTPYYMAPEAAAGSTKEIDARSDVYALGAVLFQVLTGEPAFVGDSLIELLRSIVSDPATPPSKVQAGIPAELDAIVLQCLEKEPHRRYADANELAADLARFVQGEPVSASRSSLSRGLRRISRSKAWLVLPLVLALGVLGLVLDRVWLAPARAGRLQLQAELDWQETTLRPTLYGLDPRHPLELNPGDLRKRLDQLEGVKEIVEPARYLEARGHLSAYVWLLERTKGRRRSPSSLEAVPGRPDVAVRAIVLAEGGDFTGAQRLLAAALPDAPELRATELALLARHEPSRFLVSGPSEGSLSELKASLLPLALEKHFAQLLGDGLPGGQGEFKRRLEAGRASLERWGDPGAAAAKAALSQALGEQAGRYAGLERLDELLAFERLDRLRAAFHSVSGCSSPPELEANLKASLGACLDVAARSDSSGGDTQRAFEVERSLGLLTRKLHEQARFKTFLMLIVAKQSGNSRGGWEAGPRSLAAVARQGGAQLGEQDTRWLRGMIQVKPALAGAYRELYPHDPFTPFLPVFERKRLLPPREVSRLAEAQPGLPRALAWMLRHATGRDLLDEVRAGRMPRSEAVEAVAALHAAAVRTGAPVLRSEWRLWDLNWCLASLRGDPDPAREAFVIHVGSLRRAYEEGRLNTSSLSHGLIRLAAISTPVQGEPLLVEALDLSPDWDAEVQGVRSAWR